MTRHIKLANLDAQFYYFISKPGNMFTNKFCFLLRLFLDELKHFIDKFDHDQ